MTTKKPKAMINRKADDFQTPKNAILPIIKYLDKSKVVWECACGFGNLVSSFRQAGFTCFGTDIKDGYDFLTYSPENYDYIVTNPPFSLKQQFLERCYRLDKPFALLLPLTTFETRKRQKLFEKYGVQVIFLDKRIRFETPSGRKGKSSSPWFASAWFTWKLNLEKDMIFRELL